MTKEKTKTEPQVDTATKSGFKFLTIDIFDGQLKSLYYNSESGEYEKRAPKESELRRYN